MKEQEGHNAIVKKPFPGFQTYFASTNVDICFGAGGVGNGKAGLMNSHVATPYGFRKVKDLKVGDILCNPDTGGQERIVYLHPISKFPFYRILFNDGTYFDCSGGHLWKIRVNGRHSKRKDEQGNIDDWRLWTAEMVYDFIQKKRNGMYVGSNISIPLTKPLQFSCPVTPTTPMPIEPYIMGALLGDGCFSISAIRSCHCVKFTTIDKHLRDKFVEFGYDMSHENHKKGTGCIDYDIRDKSLIDGIIALKLDGCTSAKKFIPRIYKYSVISKRKEILRGLLDTDGFIGQDGVISYTTISKQLADDVAFIVRSIGGRASITTKRAGYKNKYGEYVRCNIAYNVWINTTCNDELFTLPRKLERVKKQGTYRKFSLEKYVTNVEFLGNKKGRCISVDNPSGLYVVDDFTVTHNSYSLVLGFAEPLMLDTGFRCLISRRSLGNQKAGGGFVDTFKDIFGEYVKVKEADTPRISFSSGAYCDLTYIDPTNIDRMRERAKGWQYDAIAIDELTEMPWEVFTYIQSRNRGKSKTFTGKFRATFNPKRTHWTRRFIDWYVGVDGKGIPDRIGKVRFFFVAGSTVDDTVWGDSKEEVYAKCKIQIDSLIKDLKGKAKYQDFIKSFTLYEGTVDENEALMEGNAGYVGSVAASGTRSAAGLIGVNYNADPDSDEKIPIPSNSAQGVFNNNPAVNGDKWITVDLADYGTDNLVALAWDGFHAYDILILSKSTPRENAMAVKTFAFEHGTAESHIIFDATAGRYFNDYIPDAVPYISLNKPFGLYQLTAMTVKDMCYIRLCKMIESGNLTFDDKLAVQTYTHQNLKYKVTVENEFMEECSVVRFDDMQSGKKRLWNKKKMNQMLGKGRSMDLLDPCAMRMLSCANIEYGNEVQAGYYNSVEESKQAKGVVTEGSIYDEHLWY